MSEAVRPPSQTLSGAEAVAAALVAMPAAVVVSAYLIDRAGGAFRPALMLPLALAAGAVTLTASWRHTAWTRDDLAAFGVILLTTFAWLMWIARPSFLPMGNGPDLTHHLLLIQYIERHWRLVHVPGVEDYLGEMVNYTPGSHILVALAAAWSARSGLHALHAVLAASVALKTGFVFLIARRVLPSSVPRVALATLASIALFASQTYFLGSFAESSFVAQVVSELFAVAMWWALTVWDEQGGLGAMAGAGLTGAAVFLTWPVLIGPLLLVLGVLVLLPRPQPFFTRLAHATLAAAPIALVAGLFVAGRLGMMVIVGTSGGAVRPGPAAYGWWFLALSTTGLIVAVFRAGASITRTPDSSGTRGLVILVAAIGLQAAVLYWFARANSNEPYMALKMFYLLLYPQAVAIAVLVGEMWRVAGGVFSRVWPGRSIDARLAWMLVALVVFLSARPLAGAPQSLRLAHQPAASAPLEQAGLWARDHLPIKCVEYLVPDIGTAYWLHLAVLGNARQGQRTAVIDTYQLTPTLVRWLTPGGLPYGIADLPSIPSGIRDEFDIVQSFGTAAVVKRRGPAACAEGR